MQPAVTARPETLPGLTGLRGLSAVWVCGYHFQQGFGLHWPLVDAGFLGLDLFFILSGFVLSHAHADVSWSPTGYAGFLRARLARLFPLHWATLGLTASLCAASPGFRAAVPGHAASGLLANVLLIQTLGLAQSWNVPAWSLSTEWLLCLGLPAFLWLARRVTQPAAAVSLCTLCLLVFAAGILFTQACLPRLSDGGQWARGLSEFMAGCLLYRAHILRTRLPAAVTLAAAAMILAAVLIPSLALLAVLGLPAVILHAAQSASRPGRLLAAPPMIALGRISFSIYLLHWILLVLLQHYLSEHYAVPGRVLTLGTFLALSGGYAIAVISLSAATYRLIELPLRRLLRGRI